MKFSSDEFYLKSPSEMKEIFKDIPEAVKNTITIAERCNVEFKLGEILLPKYNTEGGEDPYLFACKASYSPALKENRQRRSQLYKERPQMELNVIRKMDYASTS